MHEHMDEHILLPMYRQYLQYISTYNSLEDADLWFWQIIMFAPILRAKFESGMITSLHSMPLPSLQ
jgi:hypothetical protein